MIYSLPAAVFARLEPVIPARVARYSGQQQVDMTGDTRVALAVRFERFALAGQTGPAAAYQAEFSITVHVAEATASDADKNMAEALFAAALKQLLGWEITAGRACRLIDGPDLDAQEGIAAYGFGIAVPTFIRNL